MKKELRHTYSVNVPVRKHEVALQVSSSLLPPLDLRLVAALTCTDMPWTYQCSWKIKPPASIIEGDFLAVIFNADERVKGWSAELSQHGLPGRPAQTQVVEQSPEGGIIVQRDISASVDSSPQHYSKSFPNLRLLFISLNSVSIFTLGVLLMLVM